MPKSEFKRKEKKLIDSLLYISDIRLNQSERKKNNPAVPQRTKPALLIRQKKEKSYQVEKRVVSKRTLVKKTSLTARVSSPPLTLSQEALHLANSNTRTCEKLKHTHVRACTRLHRLRKEQQYLSPIKKKEEEEKDDKSNATSRRRSI